MFYNKITRYHFDVNTNNST